MATVIYLKGPYKKGPPQAPAKPVGAYGLQFFVGWRFEAGAPVWRARVGDPHGPEVTDPGLLDTLRRLSLGYVADDEVADGWEGARRSA